MGGRVRILGWRHDDRTTGDRRLAVPAWAPRRRAPVPAGRHRHRRPFGTRPLAGLAWPPVLTAAFCGVQLPGVQHDGERRPPARGRPPPRCGRERRRRVLAGRGARARAHDPRTRAGARHRRRDGRVAQRRAVRGHLPPHQHPRRARAAPRPRRCRLPPRDAGHARHVDHRARGQHRQPVDRAAVRGRPRPRDRRLGVGHRARAVRRRDRVPGHRRTGRAARRVGPPAPARIR
jgi:hypothetical protein